MVLRVFPFKWLLHCKSKPVNVNQIYKYARLIKRMKKILDKSFHGTGKGLAAPQLGVFKQIFIVRRGNGHDFEVCINPVIISTKPEVVSYMESCLSIPGKWYQVSRYKYLDVQYFNEKGISIRAKFHHYDAEAFQHELDHLNGYLLSDRGTRIKHNKWWLKDRVETVKRGK
jgi:peptide deformylase